MFVVVSTELAKFWEC